MGLFHFSVKKMLVWIFLEPKHPHRDKHGEERHADILPRLKRWQGQEGDKEMPLLLPLVPVEHHPQVVLYNGAKQELSQGGHQRDAQQGAGQTRNQVEHPCQDGECVVCGGAVPDILEAPQVICADSVHKCSQGRGDGCNESDDKRDERNHLLVSGENTISKKILNNIFFSFF